MSTNREDFSKTSTAGITCWPTSKGLDFLVRSDDGRQRRDRIAYDHMKGTVAGNAVTVVIDTNADEIVVTSASGHAYRLTHQPKGHYFCFMRPMEKADVVDLATAAKLAGQKPAEPKPEAPADDLPF
jgi:hypothetical protein